jgi:hypothetical protein
VQPGYYFEDFSTTGNANSINFSKNGFSYTASALSGLGEFTVPGANVPSLSTNLNHLIPITFEFTSSNVTAVGGTFFMEDIHGNVINGTIVLGLSDGTSVVLQNQTLNSFEGFTSDTNITSLTVSPRTANYASVAGFYVGAQAVVPEPASITLLGVGAVGLLGYTLRPRKLAMA